MKNFTTIRLRLWIPILVFGSFSMLLFFFILSEHHQTTRKLEENAFTWLREQLAHTGSRIETFRKNGLDNLVAIELADLAIPIQVHSLMFVDDQNLILSGSQLAGRGHSITELLPVFDRHRFLSVQESRKPDIHLSSDSKSIVAYQPVVLSRKSGEIRPSRVGVIIVNYDLSRDHDRLWSLLVVNSLSVWAAALVLMLALWAALNQWLTRPLFHLKTIVNSFRQGDYLVRAEVTGQGELFELSESFNAMAAEVQRMTEALQTSGERFQLAMRGANDGLWDWNLLTDEVYYSPRWKSMLGYAADELEPNLDTWKRLMHPDDVERVLAFVRDFLDGHFSKYELELRMRHKDGSFRHILVRGFLVDDAQGRHMRLVGTHVDITERKKNEEQIECSLQEKQISEERYALAQQAAQIGSLDWNVRTGEIVWSEQTEPLFGFEKGGLGDTLDAYLAYVHPDDRELVRHSARKAIEDGKKYDIEHRIILPDNSIHWIRQICDVLRDANDKPLRMIGIIQDITASKREEQTLLKIKKLEATAFLAGGIAHDYNNLLAVILGNIEMAQREAVAGSPQLKTLSEAKDATLQAAQLTKKFITFSSGGSPVKKAIAPQEFIKDTVNIALSGSNIQCDFSIDQDLRMVEIDTGQISQAIINIITNSREAMPQGGTIHITAQNLSGKQMVQETGIKLEGKLFVKISVEDQGTGISKEDLANIFDTYFSSKERGDQKGMGLGLTIADSIIKKHGGHIQAESEKGKGTRVSIYLPALQQKEVEACQTADKAVDAPTPAREKKTTRILVMDDEKMLRDIAQRMLGYIGYEQVVVAPHGEEVLSMYVQAREQGETIDLFILDLTIKGGMGGEETIKRLLEMNPGVRAIVCSGYSNDPILANYAAYGFSGVLAKPFSGDELNNAITKALDNKQSPVAAG